MALETESWRQFWFISKFRSGSGMNQISKYEVQSTMMVWPRTFIDDVKVEEVPL